MCRAGEDFGSPVSAPVRENRVCARCPRLPARDTVTGEGITSKSTSRGASALGGREHHGTAMDPVDAGRGHRPAGGDAGPRTATRSGEDGDVEVPAGLLDPGTDGT